MNTTTINTTALAKRIYPISYARRRFGELEKVLLDFDFVILTKNGEPFAELKKIEKRGSSTAERLKKHAGALKGTVFDNDKIVKEILTRKSRKKSIIF